MKASFSSAGFAVALLGAFLALGSRTGLGQDATPSSPPAQKPAKSSQPSGPAASAAQDNPFPEEVSRKAAEQQHEQPPAGPNQDQPPAAAPGSQQPAPANPGSAATDNPFPEDVSRKAAEEAGQAAAAPDANDGVSSSAARDPYVDRETGRRKLAKPDRNAIEPGSLTGMGRAREDVKVGDFYLNTGDWQGAYARLQEATRLDPANLDAIFGLAEAARHLNRKQEAAQNYQLYLAVAPDGEKAKAARKALESLGASR